MATHYHTFECLQGACKQSGAIEKKRTRKMRVIGYARVLTDEQASDGVKHGRARFAVRFGARRRSGRWKTRPA